MTCLFTPQLFQSLITATTPAIVVVSYRVHLVIVLVVILCRVKPGRSFDLCGNRLV